MIKNLFQTYSALLLLLSITPASFAINDTNIQTNSQNDISVWTTYGDPQPNDPKITANYRRGNGNQITQIIILSNPFRDKGILPYTKIKPTDDTPQSIKIKSTAGEYESASFVIQTGEQPLQTVKIVASNLISEDSKNTIPSNNIDIRLVKTWFQSSDVMRRGDRDTPKQLVPELLLHDSELVKVDFDKQTNSIRTYPAIQDTNTLLPFNIPAHLNQQLWLTLLTPSEAKQGYYNGELTISASIKNNELYTKKLKISLRVLPFTLQDTPMLMGQFYLARLVKSKKTYFSARGKNKQQMVEELKDMKNHGVNLITVDHAYNEKDDTIKNVTSLRKQIKLIKGANLTDNPVVYVDWKVGGVHDKIQYQNKLSTIQNTFNAEGITNFWVYNRDEKKLATLKSTLHTFDAAHNIGSKNIVAVTKPKIAQHLKGYLDLALVQHKTTKATINDLKTAGVTPIAYGLPHAGEEKPETTRYTYGYALVKKGFEGTLSYAYQAGECWDDWMNWEKSNYRPNVMAYPTASDPIPTMQWEAWREAVDDLKYLETYVKLSGKTPQAILSEASANKANSSDEIRNYLIKNILIISQQ